MALFPCTLCNKRYAGKSNKAYVGWTKGIYSDRKVLNLCAFHIDMLREQLQRQGLLIERDGVMVDDGATPVAKCLLCTTDPVTTIWWAHLYDRSLGKEVYAIDACDKCKPSLAGMPVEASS
jgi:hypothetical protein